MRPEVVTAMIDGAIPCLGGLVATLIGFRVLGKKRGTDAKYDEWHQRNGLLFRRAGPVLIVFGIVLAGYGYFKTRGAVDEPRAAPVWKRHKTSDGVCSAEFPSDPKPNVLNVAGIDAHQLGLSLPEADMFFTLSYSDTRPELLHLSDDEILDTIREGVAVADEQIGTKSKILTEEKLADYSVVGRKIEYEVGQKHTIILKVYAVNNRLYRVSAVVPRAKEKDDRVRRFVDSLRVETHDRAK